MANGSERARADRGRLLETAAAELAKSMGQQPDEILDDLVSEVRTLEQSARVKDFVVILAVKGVKERLRQRHFMPQGSPESEAHFLGEHSPQSEFAQA